MYDHIISVKKYDACKYIYIFDQHSHRTIINSFMVSQPTAVCLNLNMDDMYKDAEFILFCNVQVSKRISELILQNHAAYAVELERVMELQRTLQAASGICVRGRR